MSSSPNRLVIIGLDGATFDLIQPWVAAGDLPNLQRLMAEGSWGPLESVVHPFTAQAWTSMVTGTQQGKHRVFDFWERDFHTYGFRLMNASHRALPDWRSFVRPWYCCGPSTRTRKRPSRP